MLGFSLGIIMMLSSLLEPPEGQDPGVAHRDRLSKLQELAAVDRARAELVREIVSRENIELAALVDELDLERVEGGWWTNAERDLGFGAVFRRYVAKRTGLGGLAVQVVAGRTEAGEMVVQARFQTWCDGTGTRSEEFHLAVEPVWPGEYEPGAENGAPPFFRAEWQGAQARATLDRRKTLALGAVPMVDVPDDLLPDVELLTSPFQRLVFGDTGGIGGDRLPGRIATDRLVRQRRFDLLRAVLRAWSPEGRIFAAKALLVNGEVEAADLRAIKNLRGQILYCDGGCQIEMRNVRDVLDKWLARWGWASGDARDRASRGSIPAHESPPGR